LIRHEALAGRHSGAKADHQRRAEGEGSTGPASGANHWYRLGANCQADKVEHLLSNAPARHFAEIRDKPVISLSPINYRREEMTTLAKAIDTDA